MYSEDPSTHPDATIVGCVGFKKLYYTMGPQEYCDMMDNGYWPSVASMDITCDILSKGVTMYAPEWMQETAKKLGQKLDFLTKKGGI